MPSAKTEGVFSIENIDLYDSPQKERTIILYDRNGDKIGSLYPRRAKQLLLKGRADWLEEGRSLQLIKASSVKNDNEPTQGLAKEELTMEDTTRYSNEGISVEISKAPTDNALMELARANVKDKQNLIRHCIGFTVSLPLLVVFRQMILGRSIPNYAHQVVAAVDEVLWRLHPHPNQQGGFWHIDALRHEIVEIMRWNHTEPVYYVAGGVILAWGGWIALRIVKRSHIIPWITENVRIKRVPDKPKPDPVEEEYRRLKERMAR